MTFARQHLLFMHNGDVTKLAFPTMQPETYRGGTDFKYEQLGRNAAGDLVSVTLATTKRDWQGTVQSDESGGTVIYDTVSYTLGSPTQLKAALADDDLKVKSMEDSAFWNARHTGQFSPVLLRPTGDLIRAEIRLVEK
jgi:hypothetical protein